MPLDSTGAQPYPAQGAFRPNTPAVTSERFDDEVVLVNFDSGRYHSIQGVGVEVWRCLEAGAVRGDIEEHLRRHYEGAPEEISAGLGRFLEQLQKEALIVPVPAVSAPELPGPPAHDSLPSFVAPELTTYTDMQELLWLDPIHEVDESGWPVPRAPEQG